MADGILIVHAIYILFVVFGLVLILMGGVLHWAWVRNLWFRSLHGLAIIIVVLQSWLGVMCPLTVWENYFRAKAGDGLAYTDSFIAHWVHQLIFFQAEPWVFVCLYTVFGFLVLLSWFYVRPGRLAE